MMRDTVLPAPADSEYLCSHDGRLMLRLEPDLFPRHGDPPWVLDIKRERLDVQNAKHYRLSQGDFYQLLAYGHRYLRGRGGLFLVYPQTEALPNIPVFDMKGDLERWVVPFEFAPVGDADSVPERFRHAAAVGLRLKGATAGRPSPVTQQRLAPLHEYWPHL